MELNGFVGRLEDLRALVLLLQRPGLLTLIGPPGVGKSRLAVHVAQLGRGRFAADVCLVDVSAVDGPEALLTSVLEAVEPDSSSKRQGASMDSIGAALSGRNLILILDNCDRLAVTCAELASALAARCNTLRIMATSQRRLGGVGEVVWRLEPLETAPAQAALDEVAATSAVRLFVDRASAVERHFVLDAKNFAAVGQICRKLDGLPLAIEVAAEHMCALSARQLAERMDVFVSQLAYARGTARGSVTLNDALDASVSRLDDAERQLLWRLSVFDSSWTLEAAHGVCADASLATTEVTEALTGLIGRSLVKTLGYRAGMASRYQLLEVIRQYARQRLEASGGAFAARRRYATWYYRWAEGMRVGGGTLDQIDRLRMEQANLVAALRWAVDHADATMAFSLGSRLHGLWYIQGEFDTSRGWFGQLLALEGGAPSARAAIANWASNHALAQGDFASALQWSEVASAAAKDLVDPEVRALVLDGLATILMEQGHLERAEGIFQTERQVCQGIAGLEWLLSAVQYRLAAIRLECGDVAEAQFLAEQTLALQSNHGNEWMQLRAEIVLGRVALESGSVVEADELLSAALARARGLSDGRGTMLALLDLAQLEHQRNNLRRCREYIAEALTLSESRGEQLMLARVLEHLIVLRAAARPEAVLRLAGAVATIRTRLGARTWPLQHQQIGHWIDAARNRLGVATAKAAWSSGCVMEQEPAIALAREVLGTQATGSRVSASRPASSLTRREQEVTELIALGMTNREIGQHLAISEGTVRAHLEHILAKLGLRSRAEVAASLPPSQVA